MGVGYDIACKTCKISYYLGYGSYSTTLAGACKTAEDVDNFMKSDPKFNLQKNHNLRWVLAEHAGHELLDVNWDFWGTNKAGELYAEIGDWGAPVVQIPDYSKYQRVDLTKEVYANPQ